MNTDTWSYIFAKCELKDIINIALTSKWFNEIIKTNKYIHLLSKKNKNKMFYRACKYNKILIVKLLLLDNEVDKSIIPFGRNAEIPILVASHNGHVEVLKLLERIYYKDRMR